MSTTFPENENWDNDTNSNVNSNYDEVVLPDDTTGTGVPEIGEGFQDDKESDSSLGSDDYDPETSQWAEHVRDSDGIPTANFDHDYTSGDGSDLIAGSGDNDSSLSTGNLGIEPTSDTSLHNLEPSVGYEAANSDVGTGGVDDGMSTGDDSDSSPNPLTADTGESYSSDDGSLSGGTASDGSSGDPNPLTGDTDTGNESSDSDGDSGGEDKGFLDKAKEKLEEVKSNFSHSGENKN